MTLHWQSDSQWDILTHLFMRRTLVTNSCVFFYSFVQSFSPRAIKSFDNFFSFSLLFRFNAKLNQFHSFFSHRVEYHQSFFFILLHKTLTFEYVNCEWTNEKNESQPFFICVKVFPLLIGIQTSIFISMPYNPKCKTFSDGISFSCMTFSKTH